MRRHGGAAAIQLQSIFWFLHNAAPRALFTTLHQAFPLVRFHPRLTSSTSLWPPSLPLLFSLPFQDGCDSGRFHLVRASAVGALSAIALAEGGLFWAPPTSYPLRMYECRGKGMMRGYVLSSYWRRMDCGSVIDGMQRFGSVTFILKAPPADRRTTNEAMLTFNPRDRMIRLLLHEAETGISTLRIGKVSVLRVCVTTARWQRKR